MKNTKKQVYENTESVLQQNGYKFVFHAKKCQECGGKCCYGESGYIFATINEMKQVAEFLGMDFETLCLRYVRKVGYKLSFIEKPCKDKRDGISCVFFNAETKQCDIYPVRPKQCRTFPFWDMYKSNTEELVARCIGVEEK